ncbi:hypothetical protein L1987_54450 [Smallanthus sonchifolius]|uniref:Uncharacterized protein n=1 Tax=Smallanthus sonchifolius TaxID=185202 RepID=A0ACB9E7T4_9ASTR|nr:hypothetical protein L1987_54450 [Smallanthus sonchifolius]
MDGAKGRFRSSSISPLKLRFLSSSVISLIIGDIVSVNEEDDDARVNPSDLMKFRMLMSTKSSLGIFQVCPGSRP